MSSAEMIVRNVVNRMPVLERLHRISTTWSQMEMDALRERDPEDVAAYYSYVETLSRDPHFFDFDNAQSSEEHPLAWMTPRQAFELLAGNLFTMTEYRYICDHMPEVVDFTPDFQWGENETLNLLLDIKQQDEEEELLDQGYQWVCTCTGLGSATDCECGGQGALLSPTELHQRDLDIRTRPTFTTYPSQDTSEVPF